MFVLGLQIRGVVGNEVIVRYQVRVLTQGYSPCCASATVGPADELPSEIIFSKALKVICWAYCYCICGACPIPNAN
jgi:hypothetical protein